MDTPSAPDGSAVYSSPMPLALVRRVHVDLLRTAGCLCPEC